MNQELVYENEFSSKKTDPSKRYLLITGKSFTKELYYWLLEDIKYYHFSDIVSNPTIESVTNATRFYEINNCNAIIAIGGGSAIDTAKGVKALISGIYDVLLKKDEKKQSDIPLIAVPTTAGTGSEATTFAVIYKDKIKYSLDSIYLLPNRVYLYPECLKTLPNLVKKSTLLDSLCQSIEAIWSRNTTIEVIDYASRSIKLILDNYREYLVGQENTFLKMQEASYYSGKAINLSKTTLPHALSYGLTSYGNIPHGIAVSLVMPYAIDILRKSEDENIKQSLRILDGLMGDKLEKQFQKLFNDLEIPKRNSLDLRYMEKLVQSVNIDRLKNFPVNVNEDDIEYIYSEIIKKNYM